MSKHKYTDEDIIEAVRANKTLAKVLITLRLVPAGGNYELLKKNIARLNIDTSHFTGKGHLKDKTHTYKLRPLSEILIHNKLENTFNLKNRLLLENVKLRQCELCKLSTWLNMPIPLELHHIDGYRTNNTITNLQLLCPNCHSLTDNYRGKKKSRKDTNER